MLRKLNCHSNNYIHTDRFTNLSVLDFGPGLELSLVLAIIGGIKNIPVVGEVHHHNPAE